MSVAAYWAGSSQGSGMGLAAAKILTEQLEGTITLKSGQPGKTIFEVTLPRADDFDKALVRPT